MCVRKKITRAEKCPKAYFIFWCSSTSLRNIMHQALKSLFLCGYFSAWEYELLDHRESSKKPERVCVIPHALDEIFFIYPQENYIKHVSPKAIH